MTAAVSMIVVSVGTDHHRFDRLLDWVSSSCRSGGIELRVQHGSSRAVKGATNREILPHDELLSWFGRADTVILQGGPGGIFDAILCGHRPLVVPRVASLNEAVDDHQAAFAQRLADLDLVLLVESGEQMRVEAQKSTKRLDSDAAGLPAEFASGGPDMVARVLRNPPARLSWKRAFARVVQSMLGVKES